jgi:hypothetical protein
VTSVFPYDHDAQGSSECCPFASGDWANGDPCDLWAAGHSILHEKIAQRLTLPMERALLSKAKRYFALAGG